MSGFPGVEDYETARARVRGGYQLCLKENQAVPYDRWSLCFMLAG